MADSGNYTEDPAHFTYIWTIENADKFSNEMSPIFTVKEMEMTRWCLRIVYNTEKPIQLLIDRNYEDDGPDSIEIKCELSFLGEDGIPLYKVVRVESFYKTTYIKYHGFPHVYEVFSQRRAEFLPKDELTIRCRMWRIGTEISKHELCFARSFVRSNRHCFVWAIREFSTLQQGQERKLLLNTTATNQLTFYLFVRKDDGEEYLCISMLDSDDEVYRRCNIKVSLLDFEGKIVQSIEESDCSYGYFKFYNVLLKDRLLDDKESWLVNDVLSLKCEIQMIDAVVWSRIENYRYLNSTGTSEVLLYEQDDTLNVPPSSFAMAIKRLLEEGTLSDVTLQTDTKSFQSHKCILSARSPVFKAMFNGDMKEKISNCVKISDVDEDTLSELLSYIYTDTVGELEWQSAADLYRAADKYELLVLKRKCMALLKSDLSVSNVCVTLILSDRHHDPELQEAAQDFVMCQGAEFFTTDTWRNFKEENSKLCAEILERIVSIMKRHRDM